MNESKFVLRRIRKGGFVKVGGKWFHPEERFLKYDGRLDGMVYGFGRYWQGGEYLPFLDCWGTEQMHNEPDCKKWLPDPQVVDGMIPWGWWRVTEAKPNG